MQTRAGKAQRFAWWSAPSWYGVDGDHVVLAHKSLGMDGENASWWMGTKTSSRYGFATGAHDGQYAALNDGVGAVQLPPESAMRSRIPAAASSRGIGATSRRHG